jgi:hypothetical protein
VNEDVELEQDGPPEPDGDHHVDPDLLELFEAIEARDAGLLP